MSDRNENAARAERAERLTGFGDELRSVIVDLPDKTLRSLLARAELVVRDYAAALRSADSTADRPARAATAPALSALLDAISKAFVARDGSIVGLNFRDVKLTACRAELAALTGDLFTAGEERLFREWMQRHHGLLGRPAIEQRCEWLGAALTAERELEGRE